MEIVNTQKIDVKKTYVATVKNNVVDKALSFYKIPLEVKMDNNSIFPDVEVNDSVSSKPDNPQFIDPTINNDLSVSQELNNHDEFIQDKAISLENKDLDAAINFKLDNEETKINIVPEVKTPSDNISISQEEQVSNNNLNVENTNVSFPSNTADSLVNTSLNNDVVKENSVNAISETKTSSDNVLPDIPQLNVLNPIDDNNNLFFGQNNGSELQQTGNTNVNSSPIRFDASHETNLLKALDENNGNNKGNILITPEGANVIREFGVDEPIAYETNNVTHGKTGGFVNSKALLAAVIIFFLASCVFLGYEIYNYFILSKA